MKLFSGDNLVSPSLMLIDGAKIISLGVFIVNVTQPNRTAPHAEFNFY